MNCGVACDNRDPTKQASNHVLSGACILLAGIATATAADVAYATVHAVLMVDHVFEIFCYSPSMSAPDVQVDDEAVDYLLILRGCAALGVFLGHMAGIGPLSIGAIVSKGEATLAYAFHDNLMRLGERSSRSRRRSSERISSCCSSC